MKNLFRQLTFLLKDSVEIFNVLKVSKMTTNCLNCSKSVSNQCSAKSKKNFFMSTI